MTIHPGKHGPFILLSDIAPLERSLLCAWLTGTELPGGTDQEAVWLRDYLEFKRQLRRRPLGTEWCIESTVKGTET